ncbi:MAG TPA: metallophosphoesterase [Candidatus Caenarcaniphilales bacterium]
MLRLTMGTTLGCCLLESWVLEPYWLKIKRLNIGGSQASHRIVYITDIHYKGDRAYLKKIVETVNALSANFVCFGGDLVEKATYVDEALEVMSHIRFPIYGVPGNHDYSSKASFKTIADYCGATGGAWLLDQDVITKDGHIQIVGATGTQSQLPALRQELKRILLVHYPLFVERVIGSFALVLAGHSHGGQVRLPLWGALVLPTDVGPYDLGCFQTKAGPLYVNPGIGTFYLPMRFWCRPEITIIEL